MISTIVASRHDGTEAARALALEERVKASARNVVTGAR